MNSLTINKHALSEASTKRLEFFLSDTENYRSDLLSELEKDNEARHPKHRLQMCYVRGIANRIIENRVQEYKDLNKQIQTACRVAEGDVITIDMETCQKIFGENDEGC